MKQLKLPVLGILLLVAACSGDSVKEKINKAGDVAGQAVGELATGVSTGVEKALGLKVEVGSALGAKGVSTGKITVSDSSATDNVLNVYMIFANDFDGDITAKVFDQQDTEMGRSKVKLKAKKDDAQFVDFVFDKHTNLDNHCKVILE